VNTNFLSSLLPGWATTTGRMLLVSRRH